MNARILGLLAVGAMAASLSAYAQLTSAESGASNRYHDQPTGGICFTRIAEIHSALPAF
jgi:hypothetical protein